MEHTTSRLRAGTILAHGARGIRLGSTHGVHAFLCLAEAATLLPLRAGRLLFLPLDGAMREIEALAERGLPTALGHGGPDQFDPSLMASCQQFGTHRASIHHLLLGFESCFHLLLLKSGGHGGLWNGSHGGLDLDNHVVGTHGFFWQAAGFGQMDVVPQPDRFPLFVRVRLGVVG